MTTIDIETPVGAVPPPDVDAPVLAGGVSSTPEAHDSFDPTAELLNGLLGQDRMRSQVDVMAVLTARALVREVEAAAVEQLVRLYDDLGRTPSASQVGLEKEAARGSLADEIALKTGRGPREARDLVEFAAAEARTAPMVEKLQAGEATWDRCRWIWTRTRDLTDAQVADVAKVTLRPAVGGGPMSWERFRREVSRMICRFRTPEQREATRHEDRSVRLDLFGDGAAELTFYGAATTLIGAQERMDALARKLRQAGDPRTLAQLRHDIGLGLLLHGQPTRPALDEPTREPHASDADAASHVDAFRSEDGRADAANPARLAEATAATPSAPRPDVSALFAGDGSLAGPTVGPAGAPESAATDLGSGSTSHRADAADEAEGADALTAAEEFGASFDLAFPPGPLPSATVNVVVSAASLLGATNEPGEVPGHGWLDAHAVRDLAHAEGATWRRIVTDPVTGYAMSTVSPSYTPPKNMAAAVRDRDRTCRFPGCTQPAERSDLDHVREHPAGETSAENLQALHRRHHTRKTRKLWRAHMTPDGTVTWLTPLGQVHSTTPFDYRPAFGDSGASEAVRAGDNAKCAGSAGIGTPPGKTARARTRWGNPDPGPPPF